MIYIKKYVFGLPLYSSTEYLSEYSKWWENKGGLLC